MLDLVSAESRCILIKERRSPNIDPTVDQPNHGDPSPPIQPAEQPRIDDELADAIAGQDIEQLMAQVTEESHQPSPMEQGDREPQQLEHAIRRGRISAIREEDVFVEMRGIEGKNQGIVPLKQFDRPPRVGSIMDFVVERFDESEGLLILGREGAVRQATWQQLERGAIIEARVTASNKGGLELEMAGGIRAFMPASQIALHHIEDLDQFIGQRLQAHVQNIHHKTKKIILSRRKHLEKERADRRKKLWEQLEIGQVCEGVVSSITDFGAFVDLGGVDGLIHRTDLSYSHVPNPADIVSVNQQVKVKVLNIDADKQRIGLGLKQMEADPWEGLGNRIHVGDQITARVIRTADFGAFMELQPGVEGLLPASEMSWQRFINPSEVVRPGEELRVGVLSIDPSKKRLTLSLKQAKDDPWIGAERKFAVNSMVEAVVADTSDFGAFVELEPGIEGLVHISQLASHRIDRVEDVLKRGDRKQFRVIYIDESQRRIKLSLKNKEEDRTNVQQQVKSDHNSEQRSKQKIKQHSMAQNHKSGLKGGMGENGAIGLGLRDLKF